MHDTKNQNEINITTRDKLMKAWQDSMMLVRDFENHSHEISDDKTASQIFANFAEEEGVHAAKFRELLLEYQTNHI